MKNTSRIRRNNNANPSEKQGEKPAIPGQSAATIGHKQFDTKGKVTLGALHVGEAICLDENAIKLLASKAESAGLTPAGFCKLAVLERLFPPDPAARANDGREVIWRAISKLDFLQYRATALLDMMALAIRNRDDGISAESVDGVTLIANNMRYEIADVVASVFKAYNTVFLPDPPIKAA